MPKTIRLDVTRCFIMKIPKKREIPQISSNHSAHIDFKVFMKLYKDYTKEPLPFFVNDTTFQLNNPLVFGRSYYKNREH